MRCGTEECSNCTPPTADNAVLPTTEMILPLVTVTVGFENPILYRTIFLVILFERT